MASTFQASTPLQRRLSAHAARVCVVGLGFAGFPQAIEIARAGFRVHGFDVDRRRVSSVAAGHSFTPDVDEEVLGRLLCEGRFSVSTDAAALSEADVIVISVPVPLDPGGAPCFEQLRAAADTVGCHISRGALICVESTVPTGATRGIVLASMEERGLVLDRDFHLAYAPERIDPGNPRFPVSTIPRVVGGISDRSAALAASFYSTVCPRVHVAPSVEVAETAKLFENHFRFVNIGLVNELADFCAALDIRATDVIEASDTKPFAFLAHRPGLGIGGHCIPYAPLYIRDVATRHRVRLPISSAAQEVESGLAGRWVTMILQLLGGIPDSNVLVVGISYKPNVPDLRESPALRLLGALSAAGVPVAYADPLVDGTEAPYPAVSLDARSVATAACVVLAVNHRGTNLRLIRERARLVIDACGAYGRVEDAKIVRI